MEPSTEDLLYALKGLAKHELGEAFGDDAGLCWCDPFFDRGPEWPGHDEACSWIRGLVGETPNRPQESAGVSQT